MANLRREPSPSELFDRLIKLERRLSSVERSIGAVAHELKEFRESNEKDLQWVFEIITRLLSKVLPDFQDDMRRLFELTGHTDGKNYNPLDHRQKNKP
jgi:regulator of replication initiation timing